MRQITTLIQTRIVIVFTTIWLCLGAQQPAVALEADAASWYPRTVTSEKGTVVIYAPQIESWRDFDTLTALIAFRISRAGSEAFYYGSVNVEAQTDTDLIEREVLLQNVVILELAIDGLDEDIDPFPCVSVCPRPPPPTKPQTNHLSCQCCLASVGAER